MATNWNDRFIDLARFIGGWSKDRSRGVGAIIVDSSNRVLSIGYNGFPQGADDTVEERHERPEKYLWTEHAEKNAIFSAARNGVAIKDSTMYLMWFPCIDCARAIIQSGITTLVCTEPDWTEERYHFTKSKQMMEECGVSIRFIK